MNTILTIILSLTSGFISSYFFYFLDKIEKEKSVLSLDNSYSEIKNIGNATAINVSIYRVTPDIANPDKTNKYGFITLLAHLNSIKKDETITMPKPGLPIGHYDFYIIQFFCLNGRYYHQVFEIPTGRGDSENLCLPVSINKKELIPTYVEISETLLKIPKKTIQSSNRHNIKSRTIKQSKSLLINWE